MSTNLPESEHLWQLINHLTDGQLVNVEWLCDVITAHAELIAVYNQSNKENGKPVEDKFLNLVAGKKRLFELLYTDLAYLCKGRPELKQLEGQLVLCEISGPNPNACLLALKINGKTHSIICFRGSLIHFLHSAYSKIFILTHNYQHADCLPMYDSLITTEQYSDTNLLASFFNDIECLFNLNYLSLPINPPHIVNPFEYCERVEGTRRFILGHEVGHVVYDSNQDWACVDNSLLPDVNLEVCILLAGRMSQNNIIDPHGFNAYEWIDDVMHHAAIVHKNNRIRKYWVEELWCDSFSLLTILQIYKEQVLEGPPLFEIENTLIGILTYFTVMDIIEIVLHKNKVINPTHHPPSFLRVQAIRKLIKNHSVYKESSALQATLNRNWKRLNSFKMFVGGNAPSVFLSLWSRNEFLKKLTKFGTKAYHAIFDAQAYESLCKFGYNIHKINADYHCF